MRLKYKPATPGGSTRDGSVSHPGQRWKPAFLALGLFAITLLVFWPTRHFDFLNFDDPDYVAANAQVQDGLTWEGVRWAFTTSHASNWHPLTWLSHLFDCQVFGLSPGAHHLHNVVLHALNAALVFGVLFRFTRQLWPGLLVAALFAWHPTRVESVAWVAERKDGLSTFFGLLTIWAYARYAQSRAALGPGDATRAARFCWLALGCFALGLMSKPMLVTLPFVLLLLDFWPLRRLEKNTRSWKAQVLWPLIREKLPFFALAMLAGGLTLWAQRAGGTILSIEALPLTDRLVNALVSYWRYIAKLCWPSGLAVYYPFEPYPWWLGTLAGSGLIAVSVAVIRARTVPFLTTGWFWFLGMLVPVIGLLQVGTQAMADRYMYVPALGLFIIVAFGLREIVQRFRIGRLLVSAVAALLLLGCVVATTRYLPQWRDSETLFRHALNVTKGNYVACNNLGTALEMRGRFNEAVECYAAALRLRPDHPDANQNWGRVLLMQGQAAEAEVYFRRGLETLPKSAAAWLNLGSALLHQGKNAEAAGAIQRAVELDPRLPEARVGLGCLLAAQGKRDEAIAQFEIALQAQPDYPAALNNLGALLTETSRAAEAVALLTRVVQFEPASAEGYYNLANAFVALGRWPEAESGYRRALQLKPGHPPALHRLGTVLRAQGNLAGAIELYRAALGADPNHAEAHRDLATVLMVNRESPLAIRHLREAIRLKSDWVEPLNELAWLLATHRDAALRDGAEAQKLAMRAVSLTQTNDARSLDTLAAAWAEMGRFDEAASAAQQALALAETAPPPGRADRIRERLTLYQALQPHRE